MYEHRASQVWPDGARYEGQWADDKARRAQTVG